MIHRLMGLSLAVAVSGAPASDADYGYDAPAAPAAPASRSSSRLSGLLGARQARGPVVAAASPRAVKAQQLSKGGKAETPPPPPPPSDEEV